jgi:adenylate cyclase
MAVAIEIERKFLVAEVPADLGDRPSGRLRQGYLAVEPGGSEVRIRQDHATTVLTVKRGTGRTRVEEEVPIERAAFDRLWPLTEGRRVEKVRHLVPAGDGLVLEVDVYDGDLEGLVVAEVEFPSEAAADAWAPPAWLGAEVTADERYKNHNLAVDGIPSG